MRAKVIKETTTRISAKDFNWLAEVRGSRVDVAYKKYVVSYQPLFSVAIDEIKRNANKWQSAQEVERGSAWDEFRKANDARLDFLSKELDKQYDKPPIEPLYKNGGIIPYKHGKITGQDVMEMLLPVIRKQSEIIARLAERGI